ncbi:MAG: Asp-tRNA(Asn)/Glu-tRNA(Gln) amidotransferase subunit GatC [Microcystaceae cyanobacterium]
MTSLDKDTVHKIAHLARLDVTEAEEAQFSTQLSSILQYFDQLSELDTTDVLPTTRAIELSNITRSDQTSVYGDTEALLKEAPEPDGDYFRVPQIFASDEE